MNAAIATKRGLMSIQGASLFVDVVGHGYPLVLMHGDPGADHYTLLLFRAPTS
jgi:hypothetical protein